MRWYIILLLVGSLATVRGQAEIISITSFIECVQIDPSAINGATGTVQPGNFLDCTTDNATKSDTVTIVDLRLVAGTDSDATFFFELNTFNAEGSSSQTSTLPTQCVADVVNGSSVPTDCQLTNSTFSIQFVSTKYNYYYTLELNENFDVPYCHVMRYSDTLTQLCNIPVPSEPNPYNKYTSTCDARVEQLTKGQVPGSGQNANTETAAYYYNLFDSSKIESIMTGKNPDGSAFDTTPYYNAEVGSCVTPVNGSLCTRTEFSSDIFRKPARPMDTQGSPPWPWSDIDSILGGQIYTTMAYTDHTLAIPNPVPFGLDRSTVFTSGSGIGKGSGTLQILNCLGNCPAVAQNCYNTYNPHDTYALRTNGTTLQSLSLDIALFALGPQCAIYDVELLPRVAVVVTMKVTNLATGEVTFVDTDNVLPGQQATSTEKLTAFQIRNVGTINNILGPPMGGKIVVCGGVQQLTETTYLPSIKFNLLRPTTDDESETDFKAPPFPNMRDRMAPMDQVDNVLYNPWDNIINITQERGDVTQGYFPSNRYMGINAACDADGKQIPDDFRECTTNNQMFYYISPGEERTIGRGCAQIAITDQFFNSNTGAGQLTTSQFAADTCATDPSVCVPGFSLGFVMNDADPTRVDRLTNFAVTGCMASAAFEIMREIDIESSTRGGEVENFTYWKTYGSSFNTYNQATDFVSLIATDSVYKKNMPPGYNYKTPNFWLQNDGGTNRMYWDPNIGENDAAHTNAVMPKNFPISFTLTAYFVGKFLAYAAVVPSGLIVQTNCIANTAISEVSNMTLSVNNTGTSNGSYTITVDCPPASNLQVLPQFQTLLFADVVAGTVSVPQAVGFQYDSTGSTDIEPDSVCVFTLFPQSSVLTTLDTQFLNDGCTHAPGPNTTVAPPTPPFVPKFVAPPPTICSNWCNFGCYLNSPDESIVNSPCFWFLVITFFGGIAVGLVQFGVIIYYKHKHAKQEEAAEAMETTNEQDLNAVFKSKTVAKPMK